jgi:ABC-type branched-subunit amino acid transport system substrate-binding protein
VQSRLVQTLNGVTTTLIPVESDSSSISLAIRTLIRKSINIIVTIIPDDTAASLLYESAKQSPLMEAGRAWIHLIQGSTLPTFLPQGVITINAAAASSSNYTSFANKITSLDPQQYPGTGPSATVFEESLLTYDAIWTIAKSIEITQASTSVTRASVSATMQTISTYGLSGLIEFQSSGFRLTGNADIFVSNASGSLSRCMFHNGTLTTYFEPTFVGNSASVPDDQTDFMPLGAIWSLTGGGFPVPPSAIAQLAKYAVYRLNNNASALPPNTKISLLLYDDNNLPSLGVQSSIDVSQHGVIGVVGGLASAMTIVLQNVLSAYNIPQLAPSATVSQLSNKQLYPTFLRNCPPSALQGEAYMAIVQNFGWSEVNIISSTDEFAASMTQVVVGRAAVNGVTIVKHVTVDPNLLTETYYDQLDDLTKSEPRILLLIVGSDTLPQMVNAMYKRALAPAAVLAPSTVITFNMTQLSAPLGIPVSYFEGWVTTLLPVGSGPVFDALLDEVSALSSAVWPWVNPMVRAVPSCQAIFDSFVIYADAISRCVADGCNARNGTQMLSYLYSTHRTLFSGDFSFTSTGDREAVFDIFNVQNGFQQPAGRWEDKTGLTLKIAIKWPDGTTNIPIAVLPRNQNWLNWKSAAGIVLAVVAAVGMAFACGMLLVIYLQRMSPIIRSSTWEFLIVMLIGSILGFGSVFTWIGRPEAWICGLRIWIPPIAFILIIAPLLAKTWRLHRIFTLRDLRTTSIRLSLLSMIVFTLVLVQIIICIFWISMGTVKPVIENDKSDKTVAYVLCGSNLANRVASYVTYGYLGTLTIVCSYLAFRVRKLPKDFNESAWIGRTSYNTFLFAGLIIILGYALAKFRITVLILICVCTLAICFGAIILMMAPKLFNLWKHPERRASSNSSASLKKSGSQQTPELKTYRPSDYSRTRTTNPSTSKRSETEMSQHHSSVDM